MNWMTNGRHRALGTRNARKKRLQMQLPAHVQRESERRRLQSQQHQARSNSLRPDLPLPARMQGPEERTRRGSESTATVTPWYILPVIDMDESQDIQMLEFGRTSALGKAPDSKQVERQNAVQRFDKYANRVIEQDVPRTAKTQNNSDERCVFTPVKPSKHKRGDRGARTLTGPPARKRFLPENDILLLNEGEHMSQLNPNENVPGIPTELERVNPHGERWETSRTDSQKRGNFSQTTGSSNRKDESHRREISFAEEWRWNHRVEDAKQNTISRGTTQESAIDLRARFGSEPTSSLELPVNTPRIQLFAKETSKDRFMFEDDQSSEGSDSSFINQRNCPSSSVIQSMRPRMKTVPQSWFFQDKQNQQSSVRLVSNQQHNTLSVRQKRSPSKPRETNDQVGTAIQGYTLTSSSSSASSQDSIIWSCPPMNWQKQLFQLETAPHGGVSPSESIASSHVLSSSTSLFLKPVTTHGLERHQAVCKTENISRGEFCSIGQVYEKKELRMDGDFLDLPPIKQTTSWMMTSRTEKILTVARTIDQSDAAKQPSSPDKTKSTSSMKEMTSIAIYFCSMVECYKIDETITSEAASSRFEQVSPSTTGNKRKRKRSPKSSD